MHSIYEATVEKIRQSYSESIKKIELDWEIIIGEELIKHKERLNLLSRENARLIEENTEMREYLKNIGINNFEK